MENPGSVCYALVPVNRTLLVPVLLIVATSTGAALLIGGVFATGASIDAVYILIPAVLTASVSIGFLLVTMRSLLQPLKPALFVAIGTLSVFAVLVGTLVLEDAFFFGGTVDLSSARSVPADVVLHGDDVALVVGERTGFELRDILMVRRDEAPRVVEVPRAFWDAADDTLIMLNHPNIATQSIHGFAATTIAPALVRTAEDVGRVHAVLRAAWEGRIDPSIGADEFLGLSLVGLGRVFLFSFAVAMTWTAARLSRWPLFNVLTAAAYLRLVFFVPRLSAMPILSTVSSRVVDESLNVLLPDLLWLLIVLCSTIVLAVLPSFAVWQRDVHPEVGNQ